MKMKTMNIMRSCFCLLLLFLFQSTGKTQETNPFLERGLKLIEEYKKNREIVFLNNAFKLANLIKTDQKSKPEDKNAKLRLYIEILNTTEKYIDNSAPLNPPYSRVPVPTDKLTKEELESMDTAFYAPGIDPEKIKNEKLKKLYLEEIEKNNQKIKLIRTHRDLKILQQKINAILRLYTSTVIKNDTDSKENLNRLIDSYIEDKNYKEELKENLKQQ